MGFGAITANPDSALINRKDRCKLPGLFIQRWASRMGANAPTVMTALWMYLNGQMELISILTSKLSTLKTMAILCKEY